MEKKQSKEMYYMSILQLVVLTGFFGGVASAIWAYGAHYFNFTEVDPDIILSVFYGDWKEHFIGKVVAIALYSVISILAAFIYYLLLKKKSSYWWGGVYGLLLFAFLFFALNPIFSDLKGIMDYKVETIVFEICFFIIYGMFIGYSISFEYSEQKYWEKMKKQETAE